MDVVTSSHWKFAAWAADFPKDGGACVKINGLQIAVFHFADTGEWFACQNLCPHKRDNVLARGLIGSLGGEPKVACPQHKKTFSLKTGQCLSGENYSVQTFPVKVEEGKVYVGFNLIP